MPRKYIPTGRPRGGSKKGSRKGLSAAALAHVQAHYAAKGGKHGGSPARPKKAKKPGRISVVAVARFLEFGTTKMAKKPFMVAALKTSQAEALNILTNSIRTALGL